MADTSTTTDTTTAAPLLRPREAEDSESPSSVASTESLVMLLGRATGRRGPSLLVRQTAASQLVALRGNWGYSKLVVALDLMWNLAFVIVSAAILICTADERPNVPIRIWICGYALQCLLHVVLVWMEYQRRNMMRIRNEEALRTGDRVLGFTNRPNITKRCETMNTMASFIWWLVGFYWVICGGQILLHNAPRLYWLAVVFLALDVVFAIFCLALACLIGFALCCCLPCIIAILYAVAGEEGASEADLGMLPRYKFVISDEGEKSSAATGKMVPVETNSGYLAIERVLLPEDAECCICLNPYEDGVELHVLPCNHHFHCECIVRWLKMNATCPLCKFDILEGNEEV